MGIGEATGIIVRGKRLTVIRQEQRNPLRPLCCKTDPFRKGQTSVRHRVAVARAEGGAGVFVWRQVALLGSLARPYLVCRTIPPCLCGIRAHNRRDD